ncbi:MAG TPA: DUF4255 domain-containing protein [Candidatus Thiothrix moscowensis]|uniref:DUF4255 domain-containing protein n=1 Tax=Thiothrix sp. UBA2016 TaxID=1947695 RepID=UPI0025D5C036|nr:DUF4255 domain-containing protein [Thiothrix sp. UBA2016]HRJ53111.1 DUF4255 domain-containing protein [Candidatus Thiothrix moscowensis]HRJ93102.1 DUF4255 domain-containing protein [Candidatus Thiothrix moscowensis]
MSNHLAIATVTATLGQLVINALASSGVENVNVEYGRPTGDIGGSGAAARKAHIHLYQVTPDAARRNDDTPTRDSTGRLVSRPRTALNLHYLIVFYGDAKTFEPERMLGAVVRNLHARPLLSSQMIRDVVSGNPALQASNLADAPDRVRFTPAVVSMDELSKLWSVFFQTPYALSVAYDANVVLIDAEESGPAAAPVLSRGEEDRGAEAIADAQSPFPVLETLHIGPPSDVGLEPLPRSFPAASLGNVLILRGRNFVGDRVQLRFSHTRYAEPGHPHFIAPLEHDVAAAERTHDSIRFAIDQNDEWRVGTYTVQIMVEKDGKEHVGNVLSFTLAPRILDITPDPVGSGEGSLLTIQCSPAVLASQPVSLLLLDKKISSQERDADSDPLQFSMTTVPPAADVLVRLQVDGVDSIAYERVGTPPTKLQIADSQKVTIT